MFLFHMLDTFYLLGSFPSITLLNYTLSYLQNNACDKQEYNHNLGKIGLSHLLSENCDLSFLLCFSKQCLAENIQERF